MPPLPDLSQGQGGGQTGTLPDAMASIMSGIAPVKHNVEQIQSACQAIVQSNTIPGAAQVCGQIISLAVSLLPMAAQQAMMPQSSGGAGGAGGASGQGGIGPIGPGPGGPQ